MGSASSDNAIGGRVTAQLIIVLLSICFGSNFQFYSNSVINNLSTICQSWTNSSFHDHYGYYLSHESMSVLWSFSSAAVQLGCLTGAFFTRFLADRYGRRKALAVVSLSTVLGSLLDGFSELADSFEMFIAGRYLMGAGLGCGMALASILITECAPARSRGACGSCQQILIGFGNALSFVLTLSQVLGRERWWAIAVSVPPLVTSLVQFLVLIFYAYDSPRYLILTKNDLENGLKALRFYQGKRGAEIRLQAILDEKRAVEKRQGKEEKKFKFTDIFRRVEIRRPLLIALLIIFGVQMSGVAAVLAYSKTIFIQGGLDEQTAQYASLGIGLCNFVSPLLTTVLVDRAGRKLILLIGLVLCDASMLSLTFCIAGTHVYSWPGASLGAIPCLFIFQIGFALSNSIALIAPAELFPQAVRASAMTVIFVVLWLLQSLCVLAYLPFSRAVGVTYSFIPFMVCITISIGLLIVFMPETKGKSVEQVAAMFKKASVVDSSLSMEKEKILRF